MTADLPRAAPPAFTIAANNYLAFASVWAESYRRHHPGAEVYVALADRRDPRIDYERFPFRTIFGEELPLAALDSLAFRYTVLEFATAIKPSIFRHLRDAHGHDRALYFDPDILVADRLHEVEAALDDHQAALTPHLTLPLDNEHRPSERQIRMMGVYNLGFLGLRLDASTVSFLDWWHERLERFCLVDPWHGNFVDQGWMDFAPAFLERVAILRSSRLNVAYWNLPQRSLVAEGGPFTVGGAKLGFFHFSGVDLDDLGAISRHQDRLGPGLPPAVEALLAEYRRRVLDAGHRDLSRIPYGYAHFEPGHIAVADLLRRQLLRLDPHARRFRRPFDSEAADGYFAWLTAPLRFERGTLNRAALAVWESRPELVARYPAVCHDDLSAFVAWLVREGGGAQAGLGPELLAGVGTGPSDSAASPPFQQEPLRHFVHLTRPERPDWIEAVDLANPGEWTEILLEPFPGAGSDASPLTRLAMILWERHRALQRALPDPLGADTDELMRWIAERGPQELGLSARLAAAHAERLPPGALATPLRVVASIGKSEPSTPRAAGDVLAARRAPSATGIDGLFGVVVIAHRKSDPSNARLARGTELALAEAGIAHRGLDLDLDLLGNCVEGLFAPPEGVDLPVLLTHVGLRLAPWILGWVPAAATQGGRRIGYLDWGFAVLPPLYVGRLAQWDEIWTPSEFARAAVAESSPVPVRRVPPCIAAPAEIGTPPIELDAERPWLYASFRADDPLERDDPWTLLAALRRLGRERPDLRAGLVLRVDGLGDSTNPASPAAETLAALTAEAAGIELRLHHGPLSDAGRAALLARADAYLSLHRTTSLRAEAIRALALGTPVVASDYGGSRDYLDEQTGYPVRCFAWSLGRSLGPVPGNTPGALADAEHAALRIAELLDHPEVAGARALEGRRRVEALYGIRAAAARLLAELDRVRAELA